jgi:hypothetical protein
MTDKAALIKSEYTGMSEIGPMARNVLSNPLRLLQSPLGQSIPGLSWAE